MKKSLLFAISLSLSMLSVGAQDRIITRKGEVLNVKIVEQGIKVIKYKWADEIDSPIIETQVSSVEKIEYHNGKIDLLSKRNPRVNKPFGISLGMTYYLTEEDGFFSSDIDYFFLPQLQFQYTLGSNFQDGLFHAWGLLFHPSSSYRERRITPFLGAKYGTYNDRGFVAVPVGLNYASKLGLNVSFSVSEMLYLKEYCASTTMELKLGWRF